MRGNADVTVQEAAQTPDVAAARAAVAAGVLVKELTELADLAAVCRLYEEIWRPEPGSSPITIELLRALAKAGNYTFGAYDLRSGTLVGACAGFFGPPAHGELHSHIAGVLPAGLGRSVGFALKLHQRAWALRRDAAVISWTYDPLVRRNAYFNIGKLGARPAEYLPNFYGGMHDAINGRADSDRLLVRWDLRSPLVAEACAGRPAATSFAAERGRGAVVALAAGADGWPSPGPARPVALAPGDAATVLVGVPADIEAMRSADPARAAAWRPALRDTLAPLMAAGARVTGFDKDGWYVVTLKEETR
ncbi:MAG TPA: GNAT family N-acetyltransferase [Trebonia sp.]|nr:GNAT family N-acetyltransferase [Trebonia sp.]